MKPVTYRAIRAMVALAVLCVVLGLSPWVSAVERPKTPQGATAVQPGTGHAAELSATLNDPEKKAQAQAATVEVKVTGIQLIDPATVNGARAATAGRTRPWTDEELKGLAADGRGGR